MFKRKFSISVVIAFILILNPLTSFALILVHQTHSLSPKGSTSINVVANGARYRFIVGISLGGHSPNPDGGFVYSTDGYKYQQSSITWEYPEADGVFNVEGEESENNYLKSLQWQTPITNKSYQIKVKGKRWPYGPGGGGPYDPNWESTASGQITAPTIYDTALIKDSSKYKAGTEVSVDPSEVLVVEAKAADGSQDIKNSEVTIFWNLKDPSPANTGSGSLSSSSTTTDSTGLAKVDLTCSNANGDDHIVTAQDKSSEPSSSSDSGKAIVGFRVEFFKKGTTESISEVHTGSDGNSATTRDGETSQFDVKITPGDMTVYFGVNNSQVSISPSSGSGTTTITVTGKGDGTGDSEFQVKETENGSAVKTLPIKVHKPKKIELYSVTNPRKEDGTMPNCDSYGDYEQRWYYVYDVQNRKFNVKGYWCSENITMVENDDGAGGSYPPVEAKSGAHPNENFVDTVLFTWESGTLEEGHKYKWNQTIKILEINVENGQWKHNARRIDETHLEIDSESGQY